ncbi:MAG: hypothetical protein IAE94_12745 [Chthoniobacterales bacterium]|nr:hypothetical protein [Chthoniobacterales bacterium]
MEHLDVSLTWMWARDQTQWPNFFDDFRNFGFNLIPTFPYTWQQRQGLSRVWNPKVKETGLGLISDAKTFGNRIILNDSPFHAIPAVILRARKEGLSKPETEQGVFLRDANGKLTEKPNPFYRGYYYQKEMERVKALVQECLPDHIYWDIELWHESVHLAQTDPDILHQWKASGKSWEDFVTDAGTEMLRDLYNAVKEAMGERPMPQIGLYGAYATQAAPTDGVFEWSKIYPKYISLSMPSLYVQGRTTDVLERIKADYAKVGKNIIPWLSPATYGAAPPPTMESMVLESVLNGAKGIAYFQYQDFDPLHFYYHTRALTTLGGFADLMQKGAPRTILGANADLTYTCFASDSEALILVGNYNRSSDNRTIIPTVFPNALTSEIREGKRMEYAKSVEEVAVPPGGFLLYHQKGSAP